MDLLRQPAAGLLALLFGFRFLREHKEPSAGRFDLPGFVLSAGGLALLVYALSEGPRAGWTSVVVLGSAIVGVVASSDSWWSSSGSTSRCSTCGCSRDRMFRGTNLVSLFSTASFIG